MTTFSSELPQDTTESLGVDIDYGYFRTPEELMEREQEMLGVFHERFPDESGIVVFKIEPDSPYADIARTAETNAFKDYDSSIAMQPYEASSYFVFTVNLDEPVNETGSRIAHIKRLVQARDQHPALAEVLGTGLEVIDDRLNSDLVDEHCTLSEITGFHGIKKVADCMNVTSNMVVPGVAPSRDKPYALISYKAVFQIGNEAGITNLFAYVNEAALKSLARLGVRCDLLADKEFHLPIPGRPVKYDREYLAVCMPYDEHNMTAFTKTHPQFPMRKLIADREVRVFEL